MPGLPSGTVMLLFTDIGGSTRLLHELGDRYGGALADHRRLLRECFRDRDGREVESNQPAADAVVAGDAGSAGIEVLTCAVAQGAGRAPLCRGACAKRE